MTKIINLEILEEIISKQFLEKNSEETSRIKQALFFIYYYYFEYPQTTSQAALQLEDKFRIVNAFKAWKKSLHEEKPHSITDISKNRNKIEAILKEIAKKRAELPPLPMTHSADPQVYLQEPAIQQFLMFSHDIIQIFESNSILLALPEDMEAKRTSSLDLRTPLTRARGPSAADQLPTPGATTLSRPRSHTDADVVTTNAHHTPKSIASNSSRKPPLSTPKKPIGPNSSLTSTAKEKTRNTSSTASMAMQFSPIPFHLPTKEQEQAEQVKNKTQRIEDELRQIEDKKTSLNSQLAALEENNRKRKQELKIELRDLQKIQEIKRKIIAKTQAIYQLILDIDSSKKIYQQLFEHRREIVKLQPHKDALEAAKIEIHQQLVDIELLAIEKSGKISSLEKDIEQLNKEIQDIETAPSKRQLKCATLYQQIAQDTTESFTLFSERKVSVLNMHSSKGFSPSSTFYTNFTAQLNKEGLTDCVDYIINRANCSSLSNEKMFLLDQIISLVYQATPQPAGQAAHSYEENFLTLLEQSLKAKLYALPEKEQAGETGTILISALSAIHKRAHEIYYTSSNLTPFCLGL